MRQHCAWLSEGLAERLLKALARNPAERFATAQAMRQALHPDAARP
jgi:hypothetical protein